MTQGVQEQSGRLSAIEAKLHLVQVGREMLCADLVPCSRDATFQQTKSTLYCIGMNVPLNINLIAVTNGLVLGAVNASADHSLGISWHFIGDHHFYVCADVLLYIFCQRSRLGIACMKE